MWNISSAWARPGPSPATRCWSRPRPGPGPAPTHDMFYICMHVESYIILDYLTLSYIIQCFAWGVSQYFFAWVTPYFFLLGTPYFFFREPPGDRTWAALDFKFGVMSHHIWVGGCCCDAIPTRTCGTPSLWARWVQWARWALVAQVSLMSPKT